MATDTNTFNLINEDGSTPTITVTKGTYSLRVTGPHKRWGGRMERLQDGGFWSPVQNCTVMPDLSMAPGIRTTDGPKHAGDGPNAHRMGGMAHNVIEHNPGHATETLKPRLHVSDPFTLPDCQVRFQFDGGPVLGAVAILSSLG